MSKATPAHGSTSWLFDRKRCRPSAPRCPVRAPPACSRATRTTCRRRTPASIPWSSSAAAAPSSRTSTATSSSTSPPASPSPRPGTAIRDVVAAITGPGRQAAAHVRHRLLLRAANRPVRSGWPRSAPGDSAQARLLHQQRRRGPGSRPQAGPLAHRPVAGHRLLRRLPRPDLRGHVAVRLEAGPSPRLLAAGAGHSSRALPARLPRACDAGRRLRLRAADRGNRASSASPRRTKWRPSSSSRSRARAAITCRRPGFLPALRDLCDRHGILLVVDEVQTRHGPDRQDVRRRALGRRAGHHLPGQGHRQRHAAGRDHCPRRGHGLAPRQPCQHLRRQPRQLPGRPGDARSARARVHGQRHRARRAAARQGLAAAAAAASRASATSAAWG